MTENTNKKRKYFFIGAITTLLIVAVIGTLIFFITKKKAPSETPEIVENEDVENISDNGNSEDTKDISMKQIDFISKGELESLIDYEIRPDSLKYVYDKLCSYDIWQKQGYSQNDAKSIANRFIESNNQAYGILKGISYNNKSLKLVLIPRANYLKVNFGTSGPDENPESLATNETDNNIKEIDLELEYGNSDIELEYEVNNDGSIKAKYKNEITGEEAQDKQTQNFIETSLLDIDYLGNQEDIITNVLNNLDLDDNFNVFEIEVEFFNNNKVEFKVVK